MQNVIRKLADLDNSTPGDYIKDGVLMCGKCHTPKQAMKELPKSGGEKIKKLVPIVCECEAKKQKAQEEKDRKQQFDAWITEQWEEYGISDRYYSTLTFDKDDRQNAMLSDTFLQYVEQWEEMKKDNMGILLYGSVGTGKSFYACAIVNALLKKCVPAVATTFPRLLNILQGVRERQACIDHLQKYDLLLIDDLGVERDSAYAAEQVFNVIDSRARSGLPLIVTTNLTMTELKNPPTMQLARVYDRVLELCPIAIEMAGESRRAGNATARRAKARELLKKVKKT